MKKKTSNPFYSVLSWFVSLLVPVVLILGVVRLVFFSWYINIEYRTPGFPPDPYGFTQADRLRNAQLLLNYLTTDVGISYLRDLHFPPGQQVPAEACQPGADCTRLFNDNELSHMVDVKNTYKGALLVLSASLAVLVILGIYGWQGGWALEYRTGLIRGGWLTIFLLFAIVVIVLLSFTGLFILFHEIFFPQGNWSFYTSDTLIRVLPERFWRDTFLTVGGLTIGVSLLLNFIIGRVQRFLYYR